MSKKVLHLYKSFPPDTIGGVERYIHHMCKGTKTHGIESKIICLSHECGRDVIDGVEVIRYPYNIKVSSCPFSLELLFAFKREAEWADIIHYHYPWPFADMLSLFTPKNKKQIVTYHSDIVKQKFLKRIYYPLEQYFLNSVDKIIATSPNYASSSPNLRKFKSKIIILPLALDTNLYPKPETNKVTSIQETYGKDFILFIGQLRYYKGLHLLIDAMSKLTNKLVILGDGPEHNSLERLCKNMNITNVIFIRNFSEQDKMNYLKACFSLVLSSHLRSEAFGLVLLEGAMHSKPLISCSIGTGTDYINKHMETGMVVEPNAESLREAISYLITNPKISKKMGGNALSRIDKLFAYDNISKNLASIYNEL